MVTIGLREPTMRIFPLEPAVHAQPGNRIVIDFADPGSIHVDFLAKLPGPPRCVSASARMTFDYADSLLEEHNLEAYEHLILEVMHGNQALFTRSDGIERLWEISAPLLEDPPAVEPYWRGLVGPRVHRAAHQAAPLVPARVTSPIRLVVSDVDGTLVTSDKSLTDALRRGGATASTTRASASR